MGRTEPGSLIRGVDEPVSAGPAMAPPSDEWPLRLNPGAASTSRKP